MYNDKLVHKVVIQVFSLSYFMKREGNFLNILYMTLNLMYWNVMSDLYSTFFAVLKSAE